MLRKSSWTSKIIAITIWTLVGWFRHVANYPNFVVQIEQLWASKISRVIVWFAKVNRF